MLFSKTFPSRCALCVSAFFLGWIICVADEAAPAALPPPQPAAGGRPAEDPAQAALDRVNAAIRLYPDNASVYIVRGNIYVEKKEWDLAQKDYEKALQIDSTNVAARVNLGEIKFRQKQYDLARSAFAALKGDKDVGDLADYTVFLCDLFGSHEAAARQELDAFNAVGENASYYFGNVAWDLVHHNAKDARDFLQSAENIYPPKKIRLYTSNLVELGYLPLHDSSDK
jgi:Tfp pilus assembly protein PilF